MFVEGFNPGESDPPFFLHSSVFLLHPSAPSFHFVDLCVWDWSVCYCFLCCCRSPVAATPLQHGCCNGVAINTEKDQKGLKMLLLFLWQLLQNDQICCCFGRWGRMLSFIRALKLNSWNAHLYFMPTSSDSISGVQLKIIRRALATGRFQKTHHLLIWTPPPSIKYSPRRRQFKFFGAPATPPMSIRIFVAADLYLISAGPCLKALIKKDYQMANLLSSYFKSEAITFRISTSCILALQSM